MLDRFGRPIRVGWPAHHILWLRAAMTLDGHERREALQDIAELTGRSYACVWAQKRLIQKQDWKDAKRARLAQTSRQWLAAE